MKTPFALLAAAALAVVLPTAAHAQDAADDEPMMDRSGPRRERGPVNRDDAIEKALTRFERMDTDADGFVSPDEMTAAFGERAKDRVETMVSRNFERQDLNDDGVLSARETRTHVETMFDRVDSDGDGVITDEERQKAHKERRGAKGERRR